MIVQASVVLLQLRNRQVFGIRRVGCLAVRADTPQQPLGNDAAQACRDQVGLHAHILQPVNGGHSILGVDGRDDEVSGQSRAHRDFSGLTIADLAYADDIRVLTQDGAQSFRKCQPDFLINLYLGCPRDIELDRILQRDQIHMFIQQFLDDGEHRRGLAASGRSDDHDDTACVRQELVDLAVVGVRDHADALTGQHFFVLAEDTDTDLLAVDCRDRVDTHLDVAALEPGRDAAVLRNPPLDDVHAGHDLDARYHRILDVARDGHDAMEKTVDAHTDDHVRVRRLKMNVRAVFQVCALEDRVHQADGRSLLGGLLRRLLRGILRKTRLRTHLRHGFICGHILVEDIDRAADRLLRCEHRDDAPARDILRLLNRVEIQRVGHRQEQRILHHPHRDDLLLLRERLRDVLRHLRVDLGLCQVDEVDAELHLQSVDQLGLRDVALLDQHLAESFVLFLLDRQRLRKLALRQKPHRYEHVAKS